MLLNSPEIHVVRMGLRMSTAGKCRHYQKCPFPGGLGPYVIRVLGSTGSHPKRNLHRFVRASTA